MTTTDDKKQCSRLRCAFIRTTDCIPGLKTDRGGDNGRVLVRSVFVRHFLNGQVLDIATSENNVLVNFIPCGDVLRNPPIFGPIRTNCRRTLLKCKRLTYRTARTIQRENKPLDRVTVASFVSTS